MPAIAGAVTVAVAKRIATRFALSVGVDLTAIILADKLHKRFFSSKNKKNVEQTPEIPAVAAA